MSISLLIQDNALPWTDLNINSLNTTSLTFENGSSLDTYSTSNVNTQVTGIFNNTVVNTTLKITQIGNMVYIYFPPLQATADASGIISYVTQIPSKYFPNIGNNLGITLPILAYDNGAEENGICRMNQNKVFAIYKDVSLDPFSGTGTSGYDGFTFSYSL